MSKDTALKLYVVIRDKSKPYVDTGESEFIVHNFIVAAYSEEEALDMHPASVNEARLTFQHEEYMYSKHPERFPDYFDMKWVKNPKEDAYVRELGYISKDALETIRNQDVIAIDTPSYLY